MLPHLMGALPEAVPDPLPFWPIFSFGFLAGVVGGLVLSFIIIAILRGKP